MNSQLHGIGSFSKKLRRHIILGLILLWVLSPAWSNVTSSKGNIIFDVNNDGVPEAQLISTGLVLGSGSNPSANLQVSGNTILSQSLTIGGTTNQSANLHVQGSMGFSHQTISSNTTLDRYSLTFADSSSGNITLDLPYAANVSGRCFTIKKTSLLNKVWIHSSTNLIDSDYTFEMPEGVLSSIALQSDGVQWRILSSLNVNNSVASGNLIGWWKFDESSGTTAEDSSGKGHHGTLVNMSDADWVAGKINNGIDFAATNDYVDAGKVTELQDLTQATMTAWVYRPSSGTSVGLGQYLRPYRFSFIWFTDDNLYCQAENGSEAARWFNDTSSGWHHIALVYDGTKAAADRITPYFNGSARTFTSSSGTLAASLPSSANQPEFRFGMDNRAGDRDWDGQVDDVRLFNRALTTEEINRIYDEGQ